MGYASEGRQRRRNRLLASVALVACMLAAPAPALSADADLIKVRVGRHADFMRVVFDWPAETGYAVELTPTGPIVKFQAPNLFDFGRLERQGQVQATAVREGVAALAHAGTKSVKHFRHGNSVVVDLYRNEKGEVLPAVAPPPQPPAPALEAAAAPEADVSKPKGEDDISAPATAAAAAEADAGDAADAATDAATSAPALGEIPPADLAAADRPEPPPEVAAALGLEVDAVAGGLQLTLAAPDARVAAFTRSGAHWVVVDRPGAIDLTPANAAGLDVVQLPAPDKVILHFAARQHPAMTAARTPEGWAFTFRQRTSGEGKGVQIVRQHESPTGPRLVVRQLGDASIMRLVDPEVGDVLFAVATVDNRRVIQAHSLPDVDMPETANGLVVVPRTEGVAARLQNGMLSVAMQGGLRMSAENRLDVMEPNIQRSRIQPAAWRGNDRSYADGLRKRFQAFYGVADFARNPLRLELAKFALGHGYAAEAIGFLTTIAMSDHMVESDPAFKAMRGIARAMLGQFDLAAPDLDDPALAGDPQVELWRALSLHETGADRFSAAKFRRYWMAASAWPERLQLRLGMAGGEAALAAGLPALAEQFLNSTAKNMQSRTALAALGVVDGGVKVARGDVDEAIASFEVAKRLGGPAAAAKAELQLVRLESREGRITTDAAADRLAGLQIRWRGDRTEYETLKLLGALKLEGSHFREGFEALSEAAHVFGPILDTTDVRAAMSDGFEKAFLSDAAKDLSAIEAVALFKDFEQLAPPGNRGDKALAVLAERLLSLDLLDEADETLDHLVRRRLQGPMLADIGATLAFMRIDRRDWSGALAALDQSKAEPQEKSVALRRREARAEALAGLGRMPEALALLRDSDDLGGLSLKARMAWRAGDWIATRAAYRSLAAIDAYTADPLARDDEAAVLRWTVAATMLNNKAEVQSVAASYIDRMQDETLKAAMQALATPGAEQGEGLAAARAAIASVESLAGALDAYRAARQG